MKIVVVGAGHVGVTIVACLVSRGHDLVCVDSDRARRDALAEGRSPIREPQVAEMLAAGLAAGRLAVSDSVAEHADATLVFVCVGTPGLPDGALDLSDVRRCARELGKAARRRPAGLPPLLFVFHSTLPSGAMAGTVLPVIAKAADQPAGARYEVVYCPVFFREGSAVADYLAPPRIVIGERQSGTARRLLGIFDGFDAPLLFASFEAAEMAKLADNAWHALKVAFANELGRYAVRLGVEPRLVSEILAGDRSPGPSTRYLQPGGAFGGPCLTKDTRALSKAMQSIGVNAPLLGSIVESNAQHLQFLLTEIGRRLPPRAPILLIGLTFKDNADDVRGSPSVALADVLIKGGYRLSIYDPDLGEAARFLPDRLAKALVARAAAVGPGWDLVVLTKAAPDLVGSLDPGCPVLNLHRL